MAGRPKWPMSAYSASAPVSASTSEPRATKVSQGATPMKRKAHRGLTACSTWGNWRMRQPPSTPRVRNHSSMTGPKSRPTVPVPRAWTMNRATSTITETGTTHGSRVCETTPMPSTAESTEIAGVIMLSP